jgi:hypothetical protein
VSKLSLQSRVGEPEEALAAFGPVLDAYRRAGNVTHAVTALRNLVDLLVRVGDDEVAMLVLGALSDGAVSTTYGDEARRLEDARNRVDERAGSSRTDAWLARGAEHDSNWALDTARSHLTLRR